MWVGYISNVISKLCKLCYILNEQFVLYKVHSTIILGIHLFFIKYKEIYENRLFLYSLNKEEAQERQMPHTLYGVEEDNYRSLQRAPDEKKMIFTIFCSQHFFI